MKKHPILIALTILIAVFCLIWSAELQRCEALTEQYGAEFASGHLQTGFHDEIEYLKVLSYEDDGAQVYYVAKDHANGCVLNFVRTEGEWVMAEWNCIWSDYGSASDVIWPYWWHFIYSGL